MLFLRKDFETEFDGYLMLRDGTLHNLSRFLCSMNTMVPLQLYNPSESASSVSDLSRNLNAKLHVFEVR